MSDACMLFKRGSDLQNETRTDNDETLTCVACGAQEPDRTAFENRWQLVPAVCPNCLRWALVATDSSADSRGRDAKQSSAHRSDFSLRRFGSRFWAVYDGDTLICVTVYKKGARAVIERLKRPAQASTESMAT